MASYVYPLQEHDKTHDSSKLQVTILASEWGFSKGGLSTVNRELAIQLAKFSHVEVTFFLPKCSDMDKQAAVKHGISIREAERVPCHNELEWLRFPPEDLRIDVVVGHGVKLGRQAQVICKSHKCKWVQVVHSDPDEKGKFTKREEELKDIIDLCEIADFVVAVGPKLTEAFRKYLSWCKKAVFDFTPGVFDVFARVPQALDNRKHCSVLVFGHGDDDDFGLEDFDVVGRSIAGLPNTHLVFVGAYEKRDAIETHFRNLGIPSGHLKVRTYKEGQEYLKRLFCEADLLLMPPKTEGFGIISLEALSAGLPVLVSKNSGFGEALTSVLFGSMCFIDSEDPSAWTMAIKEIWDKDRKIRLKEIEIVRGNYGEEYSWSQQCKRLIEEMVKICDGHSSHVPSKREKGIERNESEQPAGHSSHVPSKREKGIERNESEQPAGTVHEVLQQN
ncbi:PREDICTED: uncharacterized protein LOC107348902 isoform X5 [Acropora digitifera]|uniref:uncharacterized protein LOC107348902 isoform X5 n=1 Tax=Acropora digitifera TaxID=70779 RepID=UPI00077A1923|nr:PREDICTED: uncharacterized protein LOC107348902 isoform X5 [Acropora digitifera]